MHACMCTPPLGQAQAAHALSSLAQEGLSHSALARGALDAIGELAGGADKEAAKAAICTLNRLRLRVNPNPNPKPNPNPNPKSSPSPGTSLALAQP